MIVRGDLSGITEKSNEATIRGKISAWLDMNDVENVPEYEIGSWAADIHTMHRRCIVEVKRYPRLSRGPDQPNRGSNAGETAYEQLRRYVDHERGQSTLDGDQIGWRGFITDGIRWWVYAWPPLGDDTEPQILYGWSGRTVTAKLLPDLLKLFKRADEGVGKEWPPADPGILFADSRRALGGLYERVDSRRSTKTQQSLWLEQLKGSGNHPDKADQAGLFVTHTLLTLISRLIAGADVPRKNAEESALLEGYVSWCSADLEILGNLKRIIDRYDWGAHQGDLLRKLYSGMVGTAHRRIYGEYYTPDWLAEKICRDVIDDDYIREQVERFQSGGPLNGVMDPACGSGTFLFHAGRRLMNSGPVQEAHLEQDEVVDFVSRMICGMDIHPVAIEMAFANMHRLLGRSNKSLLRIYQGDSLLIEHNEQIRKVDVSFTELGSKDYLILRTPEERLLTLPLGFVRNHRNTAKFVKSAVCMQPFPKAISAGLGAEEVENLKKSYDRLVSVVIKEGNGVWAWYIRNQAAPLLITKGDKMGRIVSNPPWVSNNEIKDKVRKKQLKSLGRDLGVYVGGPQAATFDLSSAFVLRAIGLYLDPACVSGWVLPQTAVSGGGQWKRLRDSVGEHRKLDLGNLAFPAHGGSSAMLVGRTGPKQRLVKRPGQKINNHDSWDVVIGEKADLVADGDSFESRKSAWLRKGKPIARNGATIYPPALVVVGSRGAAGGNGSVDITTGESRHAPWKLANGQRGSVPAGWIRECVFSKNLSAYCCPDRREVILPMDRDGKWLEDRELNEFWRNACGYYEKHRGTADATPKTLEGNLDFSSKLTKQFGKKPPWYVLYTKSGSRMYSAVVQSDSIIENTLYYVKCDTKREAWFLCGMLNSDALQAALSFFKQAPRDYHTHFWRDIPIPRYDRDDENHRALSRQAERASEAALNSFLAGGGKSMGQKKMRSESLEAVNRSGIGAEIDRLVAAIMPAYARPANP